MYQNEWQQVELFPSLESYGQLASMDKEEEYGGKPEGDWPTAMYLAPTYQGDSCDVNQGDQDELEVF